MNYGYIYAPSEKQYINLQKKHVEKGGCDKIVEEINKDFLANDEIWHRPSFMWMVSKLKKGDIVTVGRLDVLSYEYKELVLALKMITDRGASVYSYLNDLMLTELTLLSKEAHIGLKRCCFFYKFENEKILNSRYTYQRILRGKNIIDDKDIFDTKINILSEYSIRLLAREKLIEDGYDMRKYNRRQLDKKEIATIYLLKGYLGELGLKELKETNRFKTEYDDLLKWYKRDERNSELAEKSSIRRKELLKIGLKENTIFEFKSKLNNRKTIICTLGSGLDNAKLQEKLFDENLLDDKQLEELDYFLIENEKVIGIQNYELHEWFVKGYNLVNIYIDDYGRYAFNQIV